MNFLDTYGITGTGTSTPPSSERQTEQSLNEEVSQVIGQLGRFWGGFRKQSEVVLATARRDLGQVVTQAQREIGKLTTAETPEISEAGDEEESDVGESADTPIAGATRSASTEPGGEASTSSTTTTAHSFFAHLQSSIPPNIVSAVQAQLPDSLKNAQHIDFAHFGSTLSSEFQRMQGVTRAQAEEYVHKSEVLLREAMKEAGDVLREAVKVVPPESSSSDIPIIWDGTDIWMLPGLAASADESTTARSASKGKGKEVDSGPPSGGPSEDARRAVATRAESLLKQLRSNPEIIKVDPAVDTSKEAYLAWADASEASGEGFGTKAWGERIGEALSDPSDGAALRATFDVLVPSFMPEEVFWVRYFFRVHQIEAEENRRKALLQATAVNEDDFSWEDDEDESIDTKETPTSVNTLASSQHTLAPPRTTSTSDVLSLPSSHAQSPRVSSEDSYDVVSGNVSSTGVVEGEEEEEVEEEEEEEEDGEEGEEGEEEEDSDWE